MSERTRYVRWVAGVVGMSIAGVLAGPAGPAAAHAELVGSSPTSGTTLRVPVEQVSLDFDEPPGARVLQVAVIGPDGRNLVTGAPRRLGTRVTVQVRRPTRAGAYVIAYRVAAGDDHPETGSVRFAVSPEGAANATAAGSASSASPQAGGRSSNRTVRLSPAFRQPLDGASAAGGALSWVALGLALGGLCASLPLARRAARRRDPVRPS